MNLKSKIIDLLREGEKTIKELSRELKVSESVVRKELSDLMRARVVASRKVLNERQRYIGVYRLTEAELSLSEEEKKIFRRVEPALAGRTSIIVVCPKCGEEGRLRKSTERGQTVFYVFHGKYPLPRRQHRFGVCHPCYETLLGIYRKVRARPYAFVKLTSSGNLTPKPNSSLVWCWKSKSYIYDWQCRRLKWVCECYVVNGGVCFGVT